LTPSKKGITQTDLFTRLSHCRGDAPFHFFLRPGGDWSAQIFSFLLSTFVAISRIDIARFLSRLETSVGILFVVGSFLKLSVCLLVASKGLAWGLGLPITGS